MSAALRSILATVLLIVSAPTLPDNIPVLVGRVSRVVDGDTIDVVLDSGTIRARLHGIDAPEKAQPHGKESAAALANWILAKEVELEPFQQDRYDRLVASVYLGDKNINAEMVRAGHAWAYRRYMRRNDSQLCTLEAAARSSKRGLWALLPKDRIAPWEHRARRDRTSFADYTTETAAHCSAAIGKKN